MLSIVSEACTFNPGASQGVVTIKSDLGGPPFSAAFDELKTMDVRFMAQKYAAENGMVPARINGNTVGPYPVNSEGLSLEHVRDKNNQPLPQTHPRMQPDHYRVDVPVSGAI